ncbi:uncharacterized protein PV09_01300 [Verruconis gallopava]|uniref:Uncharacterized protein n=1 Tax=Verruconis gallopava TaxID=253628 RepID=A0A0D1Z602_9PEZI|nr:uncharacterized protein PV09_01300 [Verruconis gallopava]KIW08387.1 hypothetical protein PV09_01300 [Verruconis gallopava]
MFLKLPVEIRLQIYQYLLVPKQRSSVGVRLDVLGSDYHEYEKTDLDPTSIGRVLHIRIIDPQQPGLSWVADALPLLRRSKCLVRTDRFRARTMQTTYTAANNPGIEPAILATCKLVHSEAAEVLYSSYNFDFDTHVEAIGAFLKDLTPTAKKCVRSVSLVKRATPYDRDFDRCEWTAATSALSQLPSLRNLHLGVVAGKPGPNGWDGIPEWSKQDFETMVKWRNWADFEWVKEIARVRLSKGGVVKVRPIVEHCPVPGSESMVFWVAISRNVAGGFGSWVEALILGTA